MQVEMETNCLETGNLVLLHGHIMSVNALSTVTYHCHCSFIYSQQLLVETNKKFEGAN